MVINYETHFPFIKKLSTFDSVAFCSILLHACAATCGNSTVLSTSTLSIKEIYTISPSEQKQAITDLLARYFIDCTVFYWKCKTFYTTFCIVVTTLQVLVTHPNVVLEPVATATHVPNPVALTTPTVQKPYTNSSRNTTHSSGFSFRYCLTCSSRLPISPPSTIV